MTSKPKAMNKELQMLLLESVDQAVRHAKGKDVSGLRFTKIEVRPVEKVSGEVIRSLRKELALTQILFAEICNVGESTVQAWESGENQPRGATLRLLSVFRENPSIAKKLLKEKTYRVISE